MAIKVGNRYKCYICDKLFDKAQECELHQIKEHDIIFVPIDRKDLGGLIQFLYTKNEASLNPKMVMMLQKLFRHKPNITKEDLL